MGELYAPSAGSMTSSLDFSCFMSNFKVFARKQIPKWFEHRHPMLEVHGLKSM